MRIITAALLALWSTLASAQAPPAVPALPDTSRLTTYTLSSSACGCPVNFALFGDGVDVDNWIQVFVGTSPKLSTDSTFGWSLTSPTGSLSTIPRPITDAVLTFNAAQSATVTIVGARRPRRLSQFTENRGIPARDHNQALTDIVAQHREAWDKLNGALVGQPGESILRLPPAATRANQVLAFDGSGNPTVVAVPSSIPSGQVTGPASSTVGDLATWGNTLGTALVDTPVLGVPHGGTGQSTLAAHGVVVGEGAAGLATANPSTAGQILIDQGAAADPAFKPASGDWTIAGSGVATINPGVVSNSKLANMAANTIKGNNTGSPTAPIDLTGIQAEGVLQFLQTGTGANQRSLDSEIKLACPHSLDWATGNGTTDDTTALGNWITQSQTIGCGYLDAATYKISSALTISAALTIYGSGSTSVIAPSSTTQNAFSITTTSAVNFYNFKIAPSGTQTAGACVLVNPSPGESSGSHFDNMFFSGCWDAIDFERASAWFVSHNFFLNIIDKAIIVRNLNNADSGDSVIVANDFQNTSAASSIGIYQEASGGLKVHGNKINTYNIGIELNVLTGISSSILPIVGNSIENCVAQCILLTTQTPSAGQWRAVQIVGNELMALTGAQAIKITAASTPTWMLGVTIDANVILVNETGSGGTGINVDNSTAVIVSHNYIEDIAGTAGTGINFTSAASLGQISQNIPRNFPAGSWITNASTTTVIDDIMGIAFANLPAAAQNGSRIFLTDGTPASSPCTGASTGSTAFRQNGAWKCF